jgi:hypothetical protein
MEEITLFVCDEPGDWFSARETTPANPPPWLDVNHPEFPRYFDITVINKDGAMLYSLQRIPKPLRQA